jgi:hypothetical protein
LNETPIFLKSKHWKIPPFVEALREQFEKMIPMIPYLPSDNPKFQEELELMKALGQFPLRLGS